MRVIFIINLEIVDICNNDKRILITSDKYLLNHPNILNNIVYRQKKGFIEGKFKL